MGYIDDPDIQLKLGHTDGDEVPNGYVRGLQEDLDAFGFSPGPIDGDFGQRTLTAVKAFQTGASGPDRRIDGLVARVPITFTGSVSGIVDAPTRAEILLWQAHGYLSAPAAPPPREHPEPPATIANVPFAVGAGTHWPVRTAHANGRAVAYRGLTAKHDPWQRRFGAPRSGASRHHVAVDLFGREGDLVVACEPGTIVASYHFYRGVYALIVQCDSGLVINYGEVVRNSLTAHGLRIGSKVDAGQPIAFVGKMRVSSMLHFETYVAGTTANKRWAYGKPAPAAIRDPTQYLLGLAAHGI